jgi:hypothetical protein
VLEATRADIANVADQASVTTGRPWAALEQALLARGARSVVVSDRADVVGVRFAIDEGQVALEVPMHGDRTHVSWAQVEAVLVDKLELVRNGRSTFAAEFGEGAGGRRWRRSRALALAGVVASLSAGLIVFGHVPASVVRVVTAPFSSPHKDQSPSGLRPEPAGAEQATRDGR